jgi:hypothetical protein
MDALVSKYANSASSASFDNADNLGHNMVGWDAASQFALPAFDIPMVANVSFQSFSLKTPYCVHTVPLKWLSDTIIASRFDSL